MFDATRIIKFFTLFLYCVLCSARDFDQNVMKTWKNNNYFAFRGIKYAEAPIGARRFRAPVPVENWGNISQILSFPLNENGNDCPQPNPSNTFNEDCLCLNVYTNNLKPSNGLRPVILLIHPGGFYVSSGNSNNFGADYLLEEDVVLVTFNYRLSYLGFSSYDNSTITPNAGFKDQVMAMKWVRDHIEHFGGDPNRVTLLGYSAGGMSVGLHLVSPISRGLFHRAALMSGSVFPPYQLEMPKSQNYLIDRLARVIGCNDKDQSAVECVKQADVKLIAQNMRKAFDFGEFNPIYPWLPVIESPSNNDEEAFLTENPFVLFSSGRFQRVPIILSTVKDEAAGQGIHLTQHDELMAELIIDFDRVGPITMMYDQNLHEATRELEAFYINSTQGDRVKLFQATTRMVTDSVSEFPAESLADLIKDQTNIYRLKFVYNGELHKFPCAQLDLEESFCKDIDSDHIVAHLDDLSYVFTTISQRKIPADASNDAKMVEKLTKLMARFAENGIPWFNDEIDPTEAKYDDTKRYVEIGANYTIKRNGFGNSDLWSRLFPKNN